MSTFHVRQQLKKHPELVGILGRRRIQRLDHATVERIDANLLDSYGDSHDRQLFVISHQGTLLSAAGDTLLKTFLRSVILNERLIDVVRRVDPEKIGYIALYDPGFTATPLNGATSDTPCTLRICYPHRGGLLEVYSESTTAQ